MGSQVSVSVRGLWIGFSMCMCSWVGDGTHVKVLLQNLAHELVLSVGDGLDNESIVLRKVKEASTLSRGTQLR